MKKFYYLFVLLFGLSIMTSCEKENLEDDNKKTEKTSKTDEDRFIGTWIGEEDGEEYKFIFKSGGKGSYTEDGERFQIEWEINEKKQILTIYWVEDEDEDEIDYEFEDGDLWLNGILFEKQ